MVVVRLTAIKPAWLTLDALASGLADVRARRRLALSVTVLPPGTPHRQHRLRAHRRRAATRPRPHPPRSRTLGSTVPTGRSLRSTYSVQNWRKPCMIVSAAWRTPRAAVLPASVIPFAGTPHAGSMHPSADASGRRPPRYKDKKCGGRVLLVEGDPHGHPHAARCRRVARMQPATPHPHHTHRLPELDPPHRLTQPSVDQGDTIRRICQSKCPLALSEACAPSGRVCTVVPTVWRRATVLVRQQHRGSTGGSLREPQE